MFTDTVELQHNKNKHSNKKALKEQVTVHVCAGQGFSVYSKTG